MLGAFAFAALGFLIGTLAGLTSQSVVTALLPLFFAFGGGSVIALLKGVKGEDRRAALGGILSLSLACVVGLYSAIVISEFQVLTPRANRQAASVNKEADPIAGRKYLRAEDLDAIAALDQQVRSNLKTREEAYGELLAIARAAVSR